jgi:hypothetical protein
MWGRYATGGGWPHATAQSRRANARIHSIHDDLWGPAILAGVLGLIGVLLLQGLLSRIVTLPHQVASDISQYSRVVVWLWVLMSAVVAGVVEETAFRGYMQRPIERRHGPVIAILVTGVVFGLMHFTHPEVSLVLLPYYVAVSAVYGMLAYLTDCVLPSMVLHAGGNIFSALQLFASGRSEWQPSTSAPPLIWDTGPDAAFWGNLAALIFVTVAALWAYRVLAVSARNEFRTD